MNFKLLQASKSLPAGLEWNDIPDFAIITGKNGTGKSHLLEAMNQTNSWEGQPFSQQGIKYISPMHSFIQVDNVISRQYIKQHNENCSKVLDIVKIIQEPDIKDTIKEFNIDLLNMAKQTASIFSSQYGNKIISSKGQNVYKNMMDIIQNIIRNISIFSKILEKTESKKIEEITEEEVLGNFYTNSNNNFTNMEYLKTWFFLYFESFNEKFYNVISEDSETRKKYHDEKHPWELINEILDKINFKYKIVNFDVKCADMEIRLIDKYTDTTVQIEDLSSGEQQIIFLVVWAHHEIISENIQLLLLDEPDSHLHPSFCKIFIDIMNEYVVKKHGVKVIMTTHSPSTVAYAPEESIFVMNEKEPRIEKQDKDAALNTLSDGLMILSDDSRVIIGKIKDSNSQYIFICEGETDKTHIENCIKLFPDELKSLFSKWDIIPAGCASNITHCRKSHKIFNKKLKGFTDNDDEGRNASDGENILPLPKVNGKDTDIEKFLGVTQKFYDDNDEIQSLKKEIIQAVTDDNDEKKKSGLDKRLKAAKKMLWKEYLTNLIKDNPDEARKYYSDLKDFLIQIHKK